MWPPYDSLFLFYFIFAQFFEALIFIRIASISTGYENTNHSSWKHNTLSIQYNIHFPVAGKYTAMQIAQPFPSWTLTSPVVWSNRNKTNINTQKHKECRKFVSSFEWRTQTFKERWSRTEVPSTPLCHFCSLKKEYKNPFSLTVPHRMKFTLILTTGIKF